MDEDKTENTFQSMKHNPKLLWGAIAVGVVILVAGIVFYAQSNGGFVGNLFSGGEEPPTLEAALEQTAARLTALRGRLESEEVSQEVIDEVVDMRRDLAAASKNADEATKAMWQVLDADLEKVEQTLRAKLEE